MVWKKDSTTVIRFSLLHGPVKYVSVGGDKVRRTCRVDHANRTGTSVRDLAVTAMCGSLNVVAYVSGKREDIHSSTLALKLGRETSVVENSQRKPVGHGWSPCCKLVTVPFLFITRRTPLMPWSNMYFLASPLLCFLPSDKPHPV